MLYKTPLFPQKRRRNDEKDQNFQQILKDANNKETIDKKENNNEEKVYNSETNKSKNVHTKNACDNLRIKFRRGFFKYLILFINIIKHFINKFQFNLF